MCRNDYNFTVETELNDSVQVFSICRKKNCAKQREDTKTKYKRIWRPKESKLNTQRNKSFAGKQLIIFFYRGYIREKLLLQLRIHFTAGFYIVCNTDFVSDGK